jgi:hypothetical protein
MRTETKKTYIITNINACNLNPTIPITTTTTTTEKPWILYMGDEVWIRHQLYGQDVTHYDGEAYWTDPHTSPQDPNYGYGEFTLTLNSDVTITNVTQLKVVVDFGIDLPGYNQLFNKIEIELTDNNSDAILDESPTGGVTIENNEFIFNFTLETGRKIYELTFAPHCDCRIKGIYFR